MLDEVVGSGISESHVCCQSGALTWPRLALLRGNIANPADQPPGSTRLSVRVRQVLPRRADAWCQK